MTKKEVLDLGYWPQEFLNGLVSTAPPITASTHQILTWKCPVHGIYTQSIGKHLRSLQCPSCSRKMAASSRAVSKRYKFSAEELSDVDPVDHYRLLQGVALRDKATFLCPIHGSYIQQIGVHLKGSSCPKCRYNRTSNTLKQTLSTRTPEEWDAIRSSIRQGKCLSRHKTLVDHYGITDLSDVHPQYRPIFNSLSSTDVITFLCPIHGSYQQSIKDHFRNDGKRSHCPACAAANSSYGSHIEQKLLSHLLSLGLQARKDRTLIAPYELDVYIPEHALAIEVNGAYYHSDNHLYNSGKDGRMYHLLKTNLCKTKGVQLLHFHAWELEYKWDICINKILSRCNLLNRTRLYARKCTLTTPDVTIARDFYDSYHIQGWGQGILYGLQSSDGTLVSCMSFRRSSSNTTEAGSWELNRYATHPDYFVVGGFSKLLTAFIREHDPSRIISYADLRLSNGSLYEHEGFFLESVSQPDYQVCDRSTGEPHHKFNFRISKFRQSETLQYKPGLTEFQLEDLNGLLRVWNCGMAKYVLTLK